jgi:hypothetical protein
VTRRSVRADRLRSSAAAMPSPASWRGRPGFCRIRGRLRRRGLVARPARLGPSPSSAARLRRCGPFRHAHRLGGRHRRTDVADARLGNAPRHRRRGCVMSLGHTRGSPTPAELLSLGLSCVFSSSRPRLRPAAYSLVASRPPEHACSACRLSLRRPGPSRSHHTTMTLGRNAVIVQSRGDSIRP